MTSHSCLITGGAGMIGVNVSRELLSRGVHVIVLDNLKAYPFDYLTEFGLKKLDVEFIHGDVRDLALVRSIVRRTSSLIHLAALADVAACTNNPVEEYSHNVEAVQKLLEILRGSIVKRFVFASSASVYGSPKDNDTTLFSVLWLLKTMGRK
jgi:UDP-glucose 4-epimerase/dTDP-L-rhamnose 4-epimerase